MKANIAKKPILSISMIVKNEGAKLRRCLESIKRLMAQIDCELIITDTGSTDDTVEIAKEYADIVNYFEWCDDYAAARNYGLELARGEWYGFLDADEWYSDELILDIAAFFKSGTYKKFNSAALMHRNYQDKECYEYYDVQLPRLTKLTKEVRFNRKIHETLEYIEPAIGINGYIYHDGYVFDTEEERDVKLIKLNEAIERQLAENFDDINLLISYSASVSSNERKEEILKRILYFAQKNNVSSLYNTAYFKLITFYFEQKRFALALNLAYDYIEVIKEKKHTLSIDGCYALATLFINQKIYDLAEKYADLYLQGVTQHKIKPDHSNTIEMSTVGNKTTEQFIITFAALFIEHSPKTAAKYYQKYDFEQGAFAADMIKNMLANYKLAPDQNVFFALLNSILAVKNTEKAQEMQDIMCCFLFKFLNDETIYTHLYNYKKDSLLVSAFIWLKTAKATGKAMPSAHSMDLLAAKGAAAPYIAVLLCMQVNIYPHVLATLNREQITKVAQQLECLDKDFLCELIFKNINFAQNATAIKELIFYIAVLQNVFDITDKSNTQQRSLIACTLVECIAKYSALYYNPALIAGGIELLPEAHRFALQIQSASKCAPSEYIHHLRTSIQTSPNMKELAVMLLEAFEKEIENGTIAPKTEFELLAESVKQSAKEYIAAGNTKDAVAVLTQLKALVANDAEIDNLIKMCK